MENEVFDAVVEPTGDSRQSIEDSRNSVFIVGTPYVHPSFAFDNETAARQLDMWDRLVLLGGGGVLGVSIGVSVMLCIVATSDNTPKTGLLVCACMILLNAVVCFVIQLRTERTIRNCLRSLNEASQES